MVTRTQHLLAGTFVALSFVYSAMMLAWSGVADIDVRGLVISHTNNLQPQWVTITDKQIDSGATIPAATYVIFTLPQDISPIQRLTLFGRETKDVRYWGFCFDPDYNPDTARESLSFPGKLFLSEGERKWRRDRLQQQRPTYSIFQPPSRDQVNLDQLSARVRHQLERFQPGARCFIMTQQPIPIGSDRDSDDINSKIERQRKLDPANPDTDGDGIKDGLEVYALRTDPLRRDTDGDKLVDGIEDANFNGIIEPGETDPREQDSDGDELCDGNCQIFDEQRLCRDFEGRDCETLEFGSWRGEDRNLNGRVDRGETDPRKADTDEDGIRDDQEYFNCILSGSATC